MKHAWSGYQKHAFGFDELRPVTKGKDNSFGGIGATIIDSLDTLYIMNFTSEFETAKNWIEKEFDKKLSASGYTSGFECTIRVLGGFLSAYYLSGEMVFLKKARLVGDKLLRAYSTQTGIPKPQVNLAKDDSREQSWAPGKASLAEFGTSQLEFYALSSLVNDKKYAEAAVKPLKLVHDLYPNQPILPTYFELNTGRSSLSS